MNIGRQSFCPGFWQDQKVKFWWRKHRLGRKVSWVLGNQVLLLLRIYSWSNNCRVLIYPLIFHYNEIFSHRNSYSLIYYVCIDHQYDSQKSHIYIVLISRKLSNIFSETRLLEIMDHLCDAKDYDCQKLLEEGEEHIEAFWQAMYDIMH